MKCPNCGSEDIQYSSKSSGGGYSAGNGCCGYMFLGPIGLLCGACGSKVETEEFWICKQCGHKFSNLTGQINQEFDAKLAKADKKINEMISNHNKRTINKYKQEINSNQFCSYISKHQTAKYKLETEERFLENRFIKLLSDLPKTDRLAKKYEKAIGDEHPVRSVLNQILLLLMIASFIVGLIPVGLALLLIFALQSIRILTAEKRIKAKLKKRFLKTDDEYKSHYKLMKDAAAEEKEMRDYVYKIECIEKYDKQNQK